MKIVTKLKIWTLIVAIMPLCIELVLADTELSKNKEFNQIVALSVGMAFMIILIGPQLVIRWIVTGYLSQIKTFCTQVKVGQYNGFSQLPNEMQDHTDENEFVILMRDMNWMAHRIEAREQQLEESVTKLGIAQAELCIQKQALEEANIHLTEMAMTDPLTRLSNRRHFFDHLEQEVYRREQNRASLSLLILDIDYFKKINDSYGHQTGDLVLVELAGILKCRLRGGDLVARVGGEEFAILLPATELKEAIVVALDIHKVVQDYVFKTYEGDDLKVQCSIGVCSDTRQSALEIQLLYRYADNALYAAKESGRNCVFSYDVKNGTQPIRQTSTEIEIVKQKIS